MRDYNKIIERLREKKLEATADKRKILKYVDSDDSGMILPPENMRKTVETISGSGMPVTDVVFNNFIPKGKKGNGGFYGPKETGENFRDLLCMHPVYIDPDSALAGAFMTSFNSYRVHPWNPDFPYDHLAPLHEKYKLVHGIGSVQHFSQDLSIGLELGWDGIRKKVLHYMSVNTNAEQREFYEGLIAIIDGMQNWISRTADEAIAMSETEKDEYRRENLIRLADINYRLAHDPPRTFREACQWILWYQIGSRMYNNSGSLGRLDLFLLPYYERDTALGALGDDEAVFIISCMLLRDTSYIQIGGYDTLGNDTTNKVSYLVLEAVRLIKIPSNIGLAVGKGIDRNLLRKGVELQFADKNGNPRFVGMDSLIKGFCKNGFDYATSALRTNTGCHWLSIPGREYSLYDCIKVNFGTVFEAAFFEMMGTGGNHSPDLLWELFDHHLKIAVAAIAEGVYFHFNHMRYSFPELYLDLLCHGPVEKGLDASGGGVEFYNFGIDGAAIATVADSFGAIQKVIVQDKRYTFEELGILLRSNWEGANGEKARLYFSNCGKYGAGGTDADEYAKRIANTFTRYVVSHKTPGGQNFIPGLFSWANTIPMGKELGATPNGRKAGEPISHGANPNPGFRKDGAATAMSDAIASVQPGYGNTAPMQIEIEPSISGEEGGVDVIMSLIEDHFENGGTLINLNVLDAEKIRRANEDPSLYPDLVVRVTGFSAYFSLLSPEFRQLVVNRLLDSDMV